MTKRNYANIKNELDDVLDRLQSDSTDIDKSIELYKKGKELVREMDAYLKKSELIIKDVKARKNKQ